LKPKQAPPQRKPNVAIIASDAPAPVVFAWHCVSASAVVGGSMALVDRRRLVGLCTGVLSIDGDRDGMVFVLLLKSSEF
jgi:hypothetical protein